MRDIFFHSKIRYIISLIMGLILLLVKLIIDNGFTDLFSYSNGTFIAGLFLICVGGLSVVNYFGFFDIFTLMVAKRDKNGHKPTLYEHSQTKKEKRKKNKFVFIPYFVIGLLYLVIASILTIIYSV